MYLLLTPIHLAVYWFCKEKLYLDQFFALTGLRAIYISLRAQNDYQQSRRVIFNVPISSVKNDIIVKTRFVD